MRGLFMFLALWAPLSAAVGGGCAGSRQVHSKPRVAYLRPHEFAPGSIALLTATGLEKGEVDEYAKLLGDLVERALHDVRPELHVVPYWRTLSLVNEKGLTKEYAEMIADYLRTGILNAEGLRKIGEALEAEYALQPRLMTFRQTRSSRLSLLGLRIVVTHETTVKILLELWDTRTGAIERIGVVDTTMASEHIRAKPIPFEDVADYAIRDLARKIFGPAQSRARHGAQERSRGRARRGVTCGSA